MLYSLHYRSATPTTSTWFIPLNYVDVVWGKCNHVDVVSIRRGIVTNHVDVVSLRRGVVTNHVDVL
jgi:hypothetical protein